jgi:hypothetical protein
MSDAGAGWQHPGVRGVLAGVVRMPSAAREHALAVVGAQHSAELDRDARRLVRALGVAEPDRAAALEVVGTVQRTVLHDALTGRRVVDGRDWSPTVRFESVHAVRREAAHGRLSVTPYQHRLAADRAALLALRQAAAATDRAIAQAARQAEARAARPVLGTAAEPVRRPVAGTGRPVGGVSRGVALPGMVFPPVPKAPAPGLVPGVDGVRRGSGRPAVPGPARSSNATRSVRFGAAAALSSVTLIFGAAIAPADDSGPEGGTDDFELDSLQLQPFGWKPFDLDGVDVPAGSEEAAEEVPQVIPAPTPTVTPSPEPEQPAPVPEPEPAAPAPAPAPTPAPPAGSTPPPSESGRPGGSTTVPGWDSGDRGEWDEVREDWDRLQESWERARQDWERARDDWRRARDGWDGGWDGS